jgi:hypothetical protein
MTLAGVILGRRVQPADVGNRPRRVQCAGQVDRLMPPDACLIEFTLQGLPEGEQCDVKRLAADVVGPMSRDRSAYILVCLPYSRA